MSVCMYVCMYELYFSDTRIYHNIIYEKYLTVLQILFLPRNAKYHRLRLFKYFSPVSNFGYQSLLRRRLILIYTNCSEVQKLSFEFLEQFV
jgi:hypothetical protein